jgi:hypothetical protein
VLALRTLHDESRSRNACRHENVKGEDAARPNLVAFDLLLLPGIKQRSLSRAACNRAPLKVVVKPNGYVVHFLSWRRLPQECSWEEMLIHDPGNRMGRNEVVEIKFTLLSDEPG